MKMTIIAASIMLLSTTAFAKKTCKDVPADKVMKEVDFKKKVADEGYTEVKFKTPGNCYEIYAKDKAGKKVEIYFNQDGTVKEQAE